MAATGAQQQKVDLRIYVGIIFLHWQMIVLCFVWALLCGVLYVRFAPKEYETHCKVMIYRDPSLVVAQTSSPWRSFSTHSYFLQGDKLRKQAVQRLQDKWGKAMGNVQAMMLGVGVRSDPRLGATLDISVRSGNRGYAEDFLSVLVEEHEKEWNQIQRIASDSVAGMLQDELVRLEEKIRDAEDGVIEYQRLHDIPRATALGTKESAYLSALMDRHNQLSTELMLLEGQFPVVKDENVGVIRNVGTLTRKTGAIKPLEEGEIAAAEEEPGAAGNPARAGRGGAAEKAEEDATQEQRGWQDLRVRLVRLQDREKQLLANLQPEHPELKAVRRAIGNIKEQLDVAAQIELGVLRDRHKALTIQIGAIEAAEYKWSAKNMLANQRRAELKRLTAVVGRFEGNYNTLYSRLHDMRISEELKAEHFRTVEPVSTLPNPIWPDPFKILVVALAAGLGSGLGLALLAQTFDNKIQTIADVEKEIGIPFLGGIPYWLHGDLERTIRPIVTEEHSTGAVEAYRALRTSLIAALAKINEKVVILTSADSKEGKTLTVLNLAIMIAQMGKRVLLVDMDLRRGRLHRSLGIEKEPGASDAIKDGRPLGDVVVKTRFENLYFVPTGSTIDNTAELLQSSNISEMFIDVRDEYDYIMIDTSPILRVTDTVIMASQGVGAVVYVARVNRTPKPLIRYSLDMLRDARVLGLIMNSIDMHKISSLYYSYQYPNYAYYSNAYAYGYDYYYYSDQAGGMAGINFRRGAWRKRRHDFVQWFRRTFLPME